MGANDQVVWLHLMTEAERRFSKQINRRGICPRMCISLVTHLRQKSLITLINFRYT